MNCITCEEFKLAGDALDGGIDCSTLSWTSVKLNGEVLFDFWLPWGPNYGTAIVKLIHPKFGPSRIIAIPNFTSINVNGGTTTQQRLLASEPFLCQVGNLIEEGFVIGDVYAIGDSPYIVGANGYDIQCGPCSETTWVVKEPYNKYYLGASSYCSSQTMAYVRYDSIEEAKAAFRSKIDEVKSQIPTPTSLDGYYYQSGVYLYPMNSWTILGIFTNVDEVIAYLKVNHLEVKYFRIEIKQVGMLTENHTIIDPYVSAGYNNNLNETGQYSVYLSARFFPQWVKSRYSEFVAISRTPCLVQ